MKRWLLLPLGLGIAAAAGWILISGLAPGPPGEADAGEQIDEQSRVRLQQILREAGSENTP